MTNSPSREPDVRGNDPKLLAAVAAGGALGGALRYGVALAIPTGASGFPWATLLTNGSGSLILGLVVGAAVRRLPGPRYRLPFFATGLLGAYTTFSTLAVEINLLASAGRAPVAASYAAATLVVGLLGAWAGLRAGARPRRVGP